MLGNVIRCPTTKKERLRAARAWADGRETHVPSRKVIVRSPVRILRELASTKMGCKVPCESSIEYDYYVILDVRHDVLSFQAQPELVQVRDDTGAMRRHYPDVRVEFTNGEIEIHEVKPDKIAAQTDIAAFHAHVAAKYARRGQRYVVVTESVIRRQPRLANAHLIRSARMYRPSQATWSFVRAALAAGPVPMGVLQTMMGGSATARMELLALTLHGQLQMDWEHLPISAAIPILLQENAR